ncbi:MAG: methyltransferase domain-containing protein [Thermomicrobiales bacterium]|nr:methyltransferase domain-containing protein [Thermomicrobiales bacterium]
MSMFSSGISYEPYVGRWSRMVAPELLRWLTVDQGARWLDVGCGTGALTSAILAMANPQSITSIDRSAAFLAHARTMINDQRVTFRKGDAQALPVDNRAFDATVSGLMLNFLPDPDRGLAEIVRATRPGGVVGIYVWDYAGGMEMMRIFWDAATAIDPDAATHDEGSRSLSLCHPDELERRFRAAGMTDVAVRPIDIPTVFRDFDDYWSPFLGAQGSAPAYVATLDADRRDALRDLLRHSVPLANDGSIHLTARAWAARGVVGEGAGKGS